MIPRVNALSNQTGQILALDRATRRATRASALADLLLVDGDPIDKLELLADPGKNFLVIMKDGTIYKNTAK